MTMTDSARADFVREKPDTHSKALRINLDHRIINPHSREC